jgi:hypothetical protein
MRFSQIAKKFGVPCFLKIAGTGVAYLIILKQAITRMPELLVANQEFELDSKFDFLYSKFSGNGFKTPSKTHWLLKREV